jgi:hypothetical protein
VAADGLIGIKSIKAAVRDPFHAHNATTVRYIYYNAEKILKGAAASRP